MDATAREDDACLRGRQRRVVLAPRRWRQALRATSSQGDGGYQARHSEESALYAVTPLRRECRDVAAYLW